MFKDHISIAKSIGIILMVFAHAGIPDIAERFIIMFHMPLFFIASGYCFKEKYLENEKDFIIHRFKGLYIPFVKYSLVFLLFHNIFYFLNIYNGIYGFNGNVSCLYSFDDFIEKAIRIVTSMSGNEQLLGGYWFLRELFYGAIISLFALKFIRNRYIALFFLLFVSFVLKLLAIRLPYWGIGSLTFLSASFFIVGYLVKKKNFRFTVVKCIAGLLIVAVASRILSYSHMLNYNSGNMFPYFMCAVLGVLAIFCISEYLLKLNKVAEILMYIGNHTMPILTWHFLSFKLVSLLIISIYDLPIEKLACFPIMKEYSSGGYWILYGVVGIVLPILFDSFLGKMGKKCQIVLGVIRNKCF